MRVASAAPGFNALFDRTAPSFTPENEPSYCPSLAVPALDPRHIAQLLSTVTRLQFPIDQANARMILSIQSQGSRDLCEARMESSLLPLTSQTSVMEHYMYCAQLRPKKAGRKAAIAQRHSDGEHPLFGTFFGGAESLGAFI